MARSLLHPAASLLLLVGLVAASGCLAGSSCDEEDGTAECYCETGGEGCAEVTAQDSASPAESAAH